MEGSPAVVPAVDHQKVAVGEALLQTADVQEAVHLEVASVAAAAGEAACPVAVPPTCDARGRHHPVAALKEVVAAAPGVAPLTSASAGPFPAKSPVAVPAVRCAWRGV